MVVPSSLLSRRRDHFCSFDGKSETNQTASKAMQTIFLKTEGVAKLNKYTSLVKNNVI